MNYVHITSTDRQTSLRTKTKRFPVCPLVRLSMLDLAHEYILTLCYALACAAVLAPLFLLFGLRYGAVETLRHRLLEDPRNREIRPIFGQTFPTEWFKEMAERSDVAFVIPHIRQIAAGVEARRDNTRDEFISMDIVPTAAGDPLFGAYDAPTPRLLECVLTTASALDLAVHPGSHIEVKIERSRNANWEDQSIILQVAGILPKQASSLRLLYLGLPMVEAIEQYKDGLAVPTLGWQGETGEATPAYDGIVVCGGKRMGEQEEANLTNGTGLTHVISFEAEDAVSVLGYPIAENNFCALLTASGALVEESSLRAVKSRIKTQNYTIVPFVRPRKAMITTSDLKIRKSVTLVSVPTAVMEQMGIVGAHADIKSTGYVAYMASELTAMSSPSLDITARKGQISIPIAIRHAPLPSGVVIIGIELGGQLNLLRDRPLKFEQKSGMIRPLRRSYTSFRLYTRTLEDVVRIEHLFHGAGIKVHTQAERIQDVLSIDHSLGVLFWLIASIAIIGGLFTLSTSLYATIERKRRDLGVLRLLGVPLRSLVIFPMAQGMAIVAAGLVISLGLYFVGSSLADTVFAPHLKDTEHLCRIRISHVAAAAGLTQVLAITAGFLASARISLSDPANILRSES